MNSIYPKWLHANLIWIAAAQAHTKNAKRNETNSIECVSLCVCCCCCEYATWVAHIRIRMIARKMDRVECSRLFHSLAFESLISNFLMFHSAFAFGANVNTRTYSYIYVCAVHECAVYVCTHDIVSSRQQRQRQRHQHDMRIWHICGKETNAISPYCCIFSKSR